MNDVMKTIRKRASCRKYTGESLTENQLKTILHLAITSPSSMNLQPWRIVAVCDQELIREMEDEGIKILKELEDSTFYDSIMERRGRMFYGAPCIIVIAIDGEEQTRSALDCGIVCQTITLAATSMDIGNVICGMTRTAFMGKKEEYFRNKLKFPKGYIFGSSVLLGMTSEFPKAREPDFSKIICIPDCSIE